MFVSEPNQREYADKIRRRYAEKEITKMDELRELDKKVRLPAKIFAYVFGTSGAMVFGTGTCLAMKVIGSALSYGFAMGIAVGIAGIAWAIANYFIYNAMLKSRKKKYSNQVITLAEELLNE